MSSIYERAIHYGRIGVATIALSGIGVACADGASNTHTPSIPDATATKLNFSFPTEAKRQIQQAGLVSQQSITLKGSIDNQPVEITNYSPTVVLNEEAAKGVYETVEGILIVKPNFPIKIGGQEKNLFIGPDKRAARSFSIIPKENVISLASPGAAAPPNYNIVPGYTSLDLVSKEAVSIVRLVTNQIDGLESNEQFLQVVSSIEMCQQMAVALIVEKDGKALVTSGSLAFSQELGCNSLGTAIGFASLDIPFKTYESYARSKSLSFGPNYEKANPGMYPYIVISQKVYDAIPRSGSIVSRK